MTISRLAFRVLISRKNTSYQELTYFTLYSPQNKKSNNSSMNNIQLTED
jgi:hypothetical protein